MAIYVVGDQNTNNIGIYLKAEASEFNSWFTETMMPTSKLWSKDIKHVVYLFSPRVLHDSQFLSNLDVVLSNVAAKSSDKQFYFCTVFPDPAMSTWMLEGKSLHEQAFVINDKIRWMTSAHPQMHVIDMEGLVLQHGLEKLHDRRFEIVGRMYFSSLLGTKLVAGHIKRYIAAAMKPRKKVLAVDLDDTLWGGVLGEEDMNIQLGGTGTGYAFLLFQREIKRLKDSGVLLAILSKNDEAHALEMIRTHPGMVLRESDFVAHRINWEPKAENLMSIADELGLGFDSFVFMDDNTYECELMKTILPEVDIINLPLESSKYVQTLADYTGFDTTTITDEDRKKTEMYMAEATRKKLRETRTLEDYLEGLEMYASVEAVTKNDPEIARVHQLIMKTNQFNLTMKRYSMDELMKKIEHDRVYKVWLTDRLGESGIVAVVILERKVPTIWTVDTFVMSCRVIQRGLEYAIMQWICDMAKGLGISYIAAARTPTKRNAMTEDFLGHCGFVFGQLKTSTRRIPKTYIQGLS